MTKHCFNSVLFCFQNRSTSLATTSPRSTWPRFQRPSDVAAADAPPFLAPPAARLFPVLRPRREIGRSWPWQTGRRGRRSLGGTGLPSVPCRPLPVLPSSLRSRQRSRPRAGSFGFPSLRALSKIPYHDTHHFDCECGVSGQGISLRTTSHMSEHITSPRCIAYIFVRCTRDSGIAQSGAL